MNSSLPLGFCPLLFQKALEMIDIRICLLSKWLLDFLTFERVKGDFRKKRILHTDFEGRKSWRGNNWGI